MADFTILQGQRTTSINQAAKVYRELMSLEVKKLVRKRVVVKLMAGAPVPWQGIDTFDAKLEELNLKATGEYELIFSDINCHGSNVKAFKSYDTSIDNIQTIDISL